MAKRPPTRRPPARRPAIPNPPPPVAPPVALPAPPVERPRNPTLAAVDIGQAARCQFTGTFRIYDASNGRGRSALIAEVAVGRPSGPLRDVFLSFGFPDFIACKELLGDDIGQWTGAVVEFRPDATRRYAQVFNPHSTYVPPAPPPPHMASPGAPPAGDPWTDPPPAVADDDIPF
jgi:hypothetical protein